jgi:hypothetical protein
VPTYDAGYRDGFAAGYDAAMAQARAGNIEANEPVFGRSDVAAVKKMQRKRRGKAAKGMGKAMREANKRLRTKSGKLRKGKTQADVARLAHKIRRQKYA